MAKQSGIHQLRGKVGEMSYYRQAGVDSGLVRKINQGLSDRVKTAEEYANTRLNNQEFKSANKLASSAYRGVRPNFRPMFRRFAVAEMTKHFLEIIKRGNGPWGSRIAADNLGIATADILNYYAKGGVYNNEYGILTFGTQVDGEQDDYRIPDVTHDISEDTVAALVAEGINGVFLFNTCFLISQTRVTVPASTVEHFGLAMTQIVDMDFSAVSGALSETINAPSLTNVNYHMDVAEFAASVGTNNAGVVMVHVMCPYRKVGDNKYILQERCTYEAFGTPSRND